jgi:2-polyprenyl-6-methoxyphenol hydroxylase-like FAD-dependent oxidoreductase
METRVDVVVVGAGVAGGALATALSRHGISVLLLEKSRVHQDRVRGEFLVPWGIDEARKLGVSDILMAAGGHYTRHSVPYGEGITPEAARTRILDISKMVPDAPGAMNLGHPRLCQALDDAAQAAGAALLRGVEDIKVTPGLPPTVRFSIDGRNHEITPRLVVGADGRGSSVARQIGLRAVTNPDHHLLAGLLVEGVEAWPQDEFSIGTDGDVMFFVFPQGGGRLRLYLGYGLDQSRRFSGAGNVQRFLDAFRLPSLPHSELLSAAHAIGPCHGYPNADAWIDMPAVPGVVLIGDAAGHNDPTIGQGLSISFRDARLVLEALLDNAQWTNDAFIPYVEERRERMRRLRFTAQQSSILRAEFTDAARARRLRVRERVAANPSVALPFLVAIKGPFGVPDHAFEPAAWDQLMN